MSIIPLSSENFETFTLELRPKKEFASGSNESDSQPAGVTGSVQLFSENSSIQKSTKKFTKLEVSQNQFFEGTVDQFLDQIKLNKNINSGTLQQYLDKVNEKTIDKKLEKTKLIKRHSPTETYPEIITGSIMKQQIKNVLFPNYRSTYASMQYAYTNYHTLNFFTASTVPSKSALLYPISASAPGTLEGYGKVSGSFIPQEAFTFEFYINPRYTTDEPNAEFHAGTVLHVSSTYAVSLVTGSSRDINGYPDGFRMLLQLSHSADIDPDKAVNSGYPNDLVFLSGDNTLRRNKWHHVAITWGTSNINRGTGSFVVDGVEQGRFLVPSASITPSAFIGSGQGNPDILCVGNYLRCNNSGPNKLNKFFGATTSANQGLIKLSEDTVSEPASYRLANPLNAEIHSIQLLSRYKTIPEIVSSSQNGPEQLGDSTLLHIPPFFVQESPTRDTLTGPFSHRAQSTATPFNTYLSFGAGARDINLENFVREFKTGVYPRLQHLTSSNQGDYYDDFEFSANGFLYSDPAIRKRNLSILPCDNGKFRPGFKLLETGSLTAYPKSGSLLTSFTNDLAALNLSLISIKDLVPSSSIGIPQLHDRLAEKQNSLVAKPRPVIVGTAASSPGEFYPNLNPNLETLAIAQITGNTDSNEIVIFDISNIYYGSAIKENTFSITDTALSSSSGKITITLKDDGYGNLYRADADTEHATWSSVGNVFYNEGITLIKSPHLSFFGKEQFETEFNGVQTLNVMRAYIPAKAGLLNSSSNPTYVPVSASLDPSDPNQKFVQITGVNLHDDNLNVIMRANFAQPVLKRDIDSFITKLRFDF